LLFSSDIAAAIRDGIAAGFSGSYSSAVETSTHAYVVATMPVVIGAVVGWLLSAALQLGWPPAFKWPTPTMPVFNLGAIMSVLSPKAALGRVGQATAKVAAVGGAAALALVRELSDFVDSPALDASSLTVRLGGAVARIAIYAGLILVP